LIYHLKLYPIEVKQDNIFVVLIFSKSNLITLQTEGSFFFYILYCHTMSSNVNILWEEFCSSYQNWKKNRQITLISPHLNSDFFMWVSWVSLVTQYPTCIFTSNETVSTHLLIMSPIILVSGIESLIIPWFLHLRELNIHSF
jgi:hypothetical protein